MIEGATPSECVKGPGSAGRESYRRRSHRIRDGVEPCAFPSGKEDAFHATLSGVRLMALLSRSRRLT